MSNQNLPKQKAPQTPSIRAGLPVRTAIRAGEANTTETVQNTVKGWWNSLVNGLPTAATTTAPNKISGQ